MKTNENGRSMIEMLGVLAIIGVLSVGGIYGYTMAMRKYKANEIAQTISMLATLARAANGGEGDSSMNLAEAGLDNTVAGMTIGATANGTQSTVVISDFSVKDKNGTADNDLVKAVCAIVPRDSTSNAGYYVSGCPAS